MFPKKKALRGINVEKGSILKACPARKNYPLEKENFPPLSAQRKQKIVSRDALFASRFRSDRSATSTARSTLVRQIKSTVEYRQVM